MTSAAAASTLVLMALVFDPGSFDPESPKALVGVLGLSVVGAAALFRREPTPWVPADGRPLVAFLVLAALALPSRFPARAADFLVHLVLVLGFYAVGRTGFLTLPGLRRPLAAGTVLVVALGILQRILGSWSRPDLRGGVEGTAFELVSGLTNPDYTGAWLMLAIPLLLHFRMRGVVALAALGLALTYSRTAWLALAGGLLLHARHPGQRRWILGGLAALAGGLFLLGGQGLTKLLNTRTVQKRLHLYRSGLTLLGRSPIIGHGPGSFGAVYPTARPAKAREEEMNFQTDFAHDLPLQILVEGGIVGMTVALWAFAPFAGWLWEESRGPPSPARPTRRQIALAAPVPNSPARALATSLTAFLLHNLFSVSAFVLATAAFAGWILGALAREKRDAAEPSPRIAWAAPLALVALLALIPGRWNFHHALAAAGRATGGSDADLATLEAAVQRVPGYAPLRYALAGRLTAKDPDRALAHYLVLEALEPWFARLHYNRARLELDRQRLDRVEPQLRAQLALQPTCYRSHFALAELRFLQGDLAKAREHLQRCLDLQPPPEVVEQVHSILVKLGDRSQP